MMKRKSVLKVTVFCAMLLCLLFTAIGVRTEQVVQAAETEEARELNYVKKNLEVSKTFTLKVDNLKAGDTVKYSSSNKKILTVSSKGVCQGVEPGTATVTATVTAKDKKTVKLTCKVTVKEMRIPTISDLTLQKDGDFIIGSSSATITFSVDKTTTATVSVCDSFDDVIYEKTVKVTKNKPAKFTWKGKDNNGDPAEVDLYYFRVDCDKAEAKTDFFTVTDVSDFSGGNGSAKKPYQITTIEEFRLMAAHNNCHFILMNDIDAEYEPLQNLFSVDAPFNGTLDGNGKSIKNLMNTTVMFNAISEDAVIKNLKLDNASLMLSNANAMLVGTNKGLIEKCTITKSSMTSNVGAMLVYANEGVIKNCKTDGEMSYEYYSLSHLYMGGMVQQNKATGKVMNCSSSVNITGYNTYGSGRQMHSGGIVGNNAGLIVSCTYSGTIKSNSVGSISEYNSGTIMSCSYLGTQEGLNISGGGSGIIK